MNISIVVHQQWTFTLSLLNQISRFFDNVTVILVSNTRGSVPEGLNDSELTKYYGYEIRTIRNSYPVGYSKNHNQVFNILRLKNLNETFLVLNPDIYISTGLVQSLKGHLQNSPDLGLIAPRIVDSMGHIEDNSRVLPTPHEVLRKLSGVRPKCSESVGTSLFYPDWIAGMFMMFSTEAFAAVGGFDERYHLYYEDVDICSRLWLAGYKVMVDPSVSVIHDAQRTSHRNLRYLSWHAQSAARFFLSPTYRRARAFHKLRQGSGNIEGLIDSLPP